MLAVSPLLLLWWVVTASVANGLQQPTTTQQSTSRRQPCSVVVGKIIIDEYKDPNDTDTQSPAISVGGGGPQAAWAAAAALAVIQQQQQLKQPTEVEEAIALLPPPPQPVIFLGPIGKMSTEEKLELNQMLRPAIQHICLIEDTTYQTPKIQLWHDEKQDLQWFPLEDSWSTKGADSLWRNRPSAKDVLTAVSKVVTSSSSCPEINNDNGDSPSIDSLFLIMESGKDAPGGGEDSSILEDKRLRQSTKIIGIEPIAFPDGETGKIPQQDMDSFQSRLKTYQPIDVITPDKYLFESVDQSDFWNKYQVAARYGEKGSKILDKQKQGQHIDVPVATLQTPNGDVVNPTGAGNCYSSAFVTCLGQGLCVQDAACIATAVGAAVCEHSNLPPWDWNTLERIREAADEVKRKLGVET